MKLKNPQLVVGYMKKSKREKAYPFVLGAAIVLIIILLGVTK